MALRYVFSSLLLSAAALLSGASAQVGTWQDGYNFFWSEHCQFTDYFSIVYVRSWWHCGPICKNNERCTMFTWSREFGGSCYLHEAGSQDALSAAPSFGKVCGFVKTDVAATNENIFWNDAYYYFWASNCRLPSSNFRQARARSATRCAEKCFRNAQCKFYTWSSHDKACYFMDMPDYDSKFSPSIADPRVGLECGFLKPFITGPSIPPIRWVDSQIGFWSHDCSLDGRHVLTKRFIAFIDCAFECTFYPECSFYTWIPENSGTCILKSADGFRPDGVRLVAGDMCGFVKPM